jgi:hypothetical protein
MLKALNHASVLHRHDCQFPCRGCRSRTRRFRHTPTPAKPGQTAECAEIGSSCTPFSSRPQEHATQTHSVVFCRTPDLRQSRRGMSDPVVWEVFQSNDVMWGCLAFEASQHLNSLLTTASAHHRRPGRVANEPAKRATESSPGRTWRRSRRRCPGYAHSKSPAAERRSPQHDAASPSPQQCEWEHARR